MSANNQLLVKEYNNRFYVFDVMAESWGRWPVPPETEVQDVNELSIKRAKGVFDTREEAHKFAHKLDDEDEYLGSEYGVVDETLYKDGADVTIVEGDARG